MNDNYEKAQKFIKISTLKQWETDLIKLNDEANLLLDKLKNDLDTLPEAWIGEAARGVDKRVKNRITDSKNSHDKMKNISASLDKVVESMSNR